MKKLVVFYSLSGNTEIVARAIAREMKADICKLEEVKKMPSLLKYVIGGYAAGRDKCSEIKPIPFDVHDYDLILLGSPIWASKPVPAVNAFIRDTDFRKKKVIPFFTMGGSGYEKAGKNIISKIEKNSGKVLDSFAVKTGRKKHDEVVKETKKAIKLHLKHLA
jgi:flavodoxin